MKVKDIVIGSLRVVVATQLVCSVLYPAVVLALAKVVVPASAEGSLVRDLDGQVRGSALLAQRFERPEFLWPRPSACDWNASAAGGSNLSPTNPKLTERAQELLPRLEASSERPAPPELVTASGGGLDPHLTLRAALYQAPRIARARPGVEQGRIEALMREHAFSPGFGLGGEPLVNVLAVNLALVELR